MRLGRQDVWRMLGVVLVSAPAIAYTSFDFMFPSLTPFSTDKNLLLILAISFLAGLPSGYFIRRVDLSMLTTMLYTAVGYALAVVMYSAPYAFTNVELVLPGLYYALFFRLTIILLFFFVMWGFIGTILGHVIRDALTREETSFMFAEKPG